LFPKKYRDNDDVHINARTAPPGNALHATQRQSIPCTQITARQRAARNPTIRSANNDDVHINARTAPPGNALHATQRQSIPFTQSTARQRAARNPTIRSANNDDVHINARTAPSGKALHATQPAAKPPMHAQHRPATPPMHAQHRPATRCTEPNDHGCYKNTHITIVAAPRCMHLSPHDAHKLQLSVNTRLLGTTLY
jgi:hypothetical protein